MAEKISGIVIRILNDREVVLNKGATDRVKEGDYIGVVDPLTENLVDPETGENLGGMRRYKVALRVTQVSERLAIAATYRTREVNVGGVQRSYSLFETLLGPAQYEKQVERLRLAKDAAQPIPESESRVQSGDPFDVISKEVAESGYTLVQL